MPLPFPKFLHFPPPPLFHALILPLPTLPKLYTYHSHPNFSSFFSDKLQTPKMRRSLYTPAHFTISYIYSISINSTMSIQFLLTSNHFNPQNFPHSSERKKRFYFVNTTVVTDPFEIVTGSSSVHSPSLTHSRSRASEVS